MIEVIIGLGVAIAILVLAVVYLLKKIGMVQAEKEQFERAFNSIQKARRAVDKQVQQQEKESGQVNETISDRNYFGD